MEDQTPSGLTRQRQLLQKSSSKPSHVNKQLERSWPSAGCLKPASRSPRSRTVTPDPIYTHRIQSQHFGKTVHERTTTFPPSEPNRDRQRVTKISNGSRVQKSGLGGVLRSARVKDFSHRSTPTHTAIDSLGRKVAESFQVSDEDENVDKTSQEYQKVLNKIRRHQKQIQAAVIPEDGDEELTSQDGSDGLNDGILFSSVSNSLDQDDDLEITKVIQRKSDVEITQFKGATRRGIRYTCARDKCVELENGEFMRITSVVADHDEAAWIIGYLFVRHNDLADSKWPRRHNEVILISRVKQDRQQLTVKRSTKQILRNRTLILTNQSYPLMSSRDHPDSFKAVYLDKEVGPLFCRWKQTHVLDKTNRFVTEESIERLSVDMTDLGARVETAQARFIWRKQHTTPGGEHSRSCKTIQQYSFFDTFCGAGGASCAARLAGLFVAAGVDSNEKAMRSYEANFKADEHGTRCYLEDIHDFILRYSKKSKYPDILHISPPCQPFSPAHTVLNQLMDELNEAAIFAVGELLKVLRPRVVTLEETFGLKNRHEVWFNALVKMFLENGYSIRWKIAKLEEYGLPQKRRRLLIIAAGPGETLPPFPAITHSDTDRTLKRLNTIHDFIGDIPRRSSITLHDIRGAMYHSSQQRPAYSAHTQAKTITTSGGIGNHHPSGVRTFTIREFAALQMFPLSYQFANVGVTAQRRQIGNAVPPYIFKKIYREIIQSLKKTDGVL